MSGPDFSRKTVDALAKRAAQTCSNPSCRKATSGPHSEASKSVVKGEAAHIRGARPGSARYDAAMTDGERAEAANSIWLCRECARVVDVDEEKFSASLLQEWKRCHENWVDAGRVPTSPGGPTLDLELVHMQCECLRSKPPADLTFSFKFRVGNSSTVTAQGVQLGLVSWSQRESDKHLSDHLKSFIDIEDNAMDEFWGSYIFSYTVASERPTIEPFGSATVKLPYGMSWPYYSRRRRFSSAIYLLTSEAPPEWFELHQNAYKDYLAWPSHLLLTEVDLRKVSPARARVGVINEDWQPPQA
jgi:hypothetical protein